MGQRSAANVRCLGQIIAYFSSKLTDITQHNDHQGVPNKYKQRAAGTGALSYHFPEPNESRNRVLQPDQQLLIKFFIHSHTILPMFAERATHDTGCALPNKKLNVQTKNPETVIHSAL